MTVQELIDQLKQYPPGARVVRQSFEKGGGYDPVTYVGLVNIRARGDDSLWFGEYEDDPNDPPEEQAVIAS